VADVDDPLTVNVPGVVVELVTVNPLGAPGNALVTVMELLETTGVGPLLFVAVTLHDTALPTSATTVAYVELVAPDISLDPLRH